MPRSEEGKFVVPKDQLKRGLCRSSVARLVCRSLLLTHFVRPGRTGYARPAGNTRKPQRPCPRAASGHLPLHRTFGDEEGLRVYREEEAYLASTLSSPCDVQRPLDGRCGDPHPAREDALADFEAHAYHHRAPFSYRSVSPRCATASRRRRPLVRKYMEAGGRGISLKWY